MMYSNLNNDQTIKRVKNLVINSNSNNIPYLALLFLAAEIWKMTIHPPYFSF